MGIVKRADWSKSYVHVPRDNFMSHALAKSKQFVPSFANDTRQASMSLILGWEYGRIWLKERNAFAAKRDSQNKPKRIKNDFKWWLDKRKLKPGMHTCSLK